MSRRERSIARANPWSFLATLLLLPAAAQAGQTATGTLDFSWSTTGVASASGPGVNPYGIFQFDDADPFDLQVRGDYSPGWQLWDGAPKSFGTTSLASSIASQISDNSTTPYPLAADGEMSATATAIKPDDLIYERAASGVNLGFVRVSPDLSLDARGREQTATLDLAFSASSSFTENPLVTVRSAFSNMSFSVAMRVGWYDAEDNLWQLYSYYSENPSDPGSYGDTWDINPYSEDMFFVAHPFSGAWMLPEGGEEWSTDPEFNWDDYQYVLENYPLIPLYTTFEMSIGVAAYATEEGRTAENPVPVPAALPLFLSGLAGVGLLARRRKKPAA